MWILDFHPRQLVVRIHRSRRLVHWIFRWRVWKRPIFPCSQNFNPTITRQNYRGKKLEPRWRGRKFGSATWSKSSPHEGNCSKSASLLDIPNSKGLNFWEVIKKWKKYDKVSRKIGVYHGACSGNAEWFVGRRDKEVRRGEKMQTVEGWDSNAFCIPLRFLPTSFFIDFFLFLSETY